MRLGHGRGRREARAGGVPDAARAASAAVAGAERSAARRPERAAAAGSGIGGRRGSPGSRRLHGQRRLQVDTGEPLSDRRVHPRPVAAQVPGHRPVPVRARVQSAHRRGQVHGAGVVRAERAGRHLGDLPRQQVGGGLGEEVIPDRSRQHVGADPRPNRADLRNHGDYGEPVPAELGQVHDVHPPLDVRSTREAAAL